jgi:hypothetical protein
MGLREYFNALKIAKDVKRAQRRFERLRKKSAYEKAGALIKRNMVKGVLRDAGYKEIRLKEKN